MMGKTNLVNSKTVFISSIIIVPLLTLIVYLGGLHDHRTLYLNSLLSTSIISFVFLIFITTGLYQGWKLKDGLGNILDKFNLWRKPSDTTLDVSGVPADLNVMDDGNFAGCIISIIVWIVLALFGSILFWLIGAVLWAGILVAGAILYWIIFRAFRLIFRNSSRFRGDLMKSLGYGLIYTVLYNCWIYAIIFGTHFLNKNF